MWISRCTQQPGLVKVWQDEGGLCFMFEKARDQADVFIVGLEDCIVRLSQPSKIFIEEFSHTEWINEFNNPDHPSPIPFMEFYSQFIALFATSTGAAEEHVAPDRSIIEGSSSGAGGNDNQSNDTLGEDISTRASSSGEPWLAARNRVHDDAKLKKVEVQLVVKGRAGDDITPFLYLMCEKRFCCKMESLINLKFTQHANEEERIMEVTVDTSFALPDKVVVYELKPASSDKRAGVLHDDLMCSYHAKDTDSLVLVKHQPTGLTVLFGKGRETATAMKLDAIQGTMFVVSPYFSSELGDNALAYIAHHQIPLKNLKFEDSGLCLDTKKKVPSMSLGMAASLECHGLFWVMDENVHRHVFEASRTLGEYSLIELDKKLRAQLLIGEQKLKKEFLVNHGFNWALFDGRLFRRILGSMGGAPNIAGLMDFP